MKKKTITKIIKSTAFSLALILFCGIISTQSDFSSVDATTTQELQDRIDALNAKNEELEGKIAGLDSSISESAEMQGYYFELLTNQKNEIDLLNNKIYYKELEIDERVSDIADIEQSILDNEREITDKERRITTLESKNSENIYKFGQIIRAMYVTDSYDTISVLMGSTDFYDLLVRSEIIKNVGEQNMKFMNELLADIDTLESEKVTLQDDIKSLSDKKNMLDEEKAILETQRAVLLDEYTASQTLSKEYNTNYYNYSLEIANFEDLQEKYAATMQANAADIETYEKQLDELIRAAQQAASNTVTYQQGDWFWPVDPKFHMITTYFGYDAWRNGNHGGIDIGNGGINGTAIYASKAGEIIIAEQTYIPGYSYGKYIVIDHGDGYQTLYGHCSEVYVSVGQMVSQGETIGAVGSTGFSTGPHLHFEVRANGSRVDPFGYIVLPS